MTVYSNYLSADPDWYDAATGPEKAFDGDENTYAAAEVSIEFLPPAPLSGTFRFKLETDDLVDIYYDQADPKSDRLTVASPSWTSPLDRDDVFRIVVRPASPAARCALGAIELDGQILVDQAPGQINDTDLLLVQSEEAIIYSDGLQTFDGDWLTAGNGPDKCFDGDENTYGLAVESVRLDLRDNPLNGTVSVKLWSESKVTFYYDRNDPKTSQPSSVNGAAWATSANLYDVYELLVQRTTIQQETGFAAIQVDGEILVDGVTTSQTETITFAQLRDGTVLNDSDKFLINDGVKTETVRWSEIKSEIVPDLEATATIAPTLVAPSVPVTCVANAFGGKAPYSFAYQWQSNETVWEDITGEIASEYIVGTFMVGRTIRCQVTVTDDAGTEIVVFSNVSDPVEAGAVAPVIGNVTLTEQDTNAPRFTDQKFDAAVTMTEEGQPVSVKTIDAYVEGAITQTGQFSALLESSAEGFNYSDFTTTSNGVAPYWEGGNQVPANIFNGEGFDSNTLNANELCTTGSAGSNIQFALPDGSPPWSGKIVLACTTNDVTCTLRYWTGSSYETQPDPTVTQFSSNNYRYTWENVPRASQLVIVRTGGKVSARGIEVNDVLLVDSNYNLTFPADTDTKFLAVGDTIEQAPHQFVEPLESSATGVSYSGNTIPVGGTGWREPPEGAFQGVSPATQSSYIGNTAWVDTGGATATTSIEVSFANKPIPANGYVEVWTWVGSGISVKFYDQNDTELTGVTTRTAAAQGQTAVNVFKYTATGAEVLISKIIVQRTNSGAFMSAIDWNGTFLEDEGTYLNFAAGADMSALEAGDEVNQQTDIEYSTAASVFLPTDCTQIGEPADAFDGEASTRFGVRFGSSGGVNSQIVLNFTGFPGGGLQVQNRIKLFWAANQDGMPAGAYEILVNGDSKAVSAGGSNLENQLSFTGLLEVIVIRANSQVTLTYGGMTINRFSVDDTILEGNAIVSGTVGSITDTTVTLTEAVAGWVDGVDVVGPNKSTSATVDAINDNIVSISSSTGTWVDGEEVTGPEKTITNDNTRKYLKFNSAGTVEDLLDAPQDPPYETLEEDPTLTLTFPSTFPSGQAPDDEIADGATLTVSVTAKNIVSEVGPETATVQPEEIRQFIEPLESSSVRQITDTWSNYLVSVNSSLVPEGSITNPTKGFDGLTGISDNASTSDISKYNVLWDCSSFNLRPTTIRWWARFGAGNTKFYFSDGTVITENTGSGVNPGQWKGISVPAGNPQLEKVVAYASTPYFTAIEIDGTVLIDNQPITGGTELVFAAGTDMSTLEAGDDVTQTVVIGSSQEQWSSNIVTGSSNAYMENPQNMYDGNPDTFGGASQSLPTSQIGKVLVPDTPIQVSKTITITARVVPQSSGTAATFKVKGSNNVVFSLAPAFSSGNGATTKTTRTYDYTGDIAELYFETSGTLSQPEIYTISIDSNELIDNGDPLVYTTTGAVASITNTTVALTEEVDGWINGEDVVGPVKYNYRSLTDEELKQQKLKFATYNNRAAVHQGDLAMQEREKLAKELQDKGINANDLLGIKAKRGRRKQN